MNLNLNDRNDENVNVIDRESSNDIDEKLTRIIETCLCIVSCKVSLLHSLIVISKI